MSDTLYKLTEKGYTRGKTFWEVGTERVLPECDSPQLCSSNVFHAYRDLNVGLLINPAHANFASNHIIAFECVGEVVAEQLDNVGCFSLEITERIGLPEWYLDENTRTLVNRIFAVKCAEAVLEIFETPYPGDPRPRMAILAAIHCIKHPQDACAAYAAADAAYAARAATYAVRAAYAARAAAYAARAAAESLNLPLLAQESIKETYELINEEQ